MASRGPICSDDTPEMTDNEAADILMSISMGPSPQLPRDRDAPASLPSLRHRHTLRDAPILTFNSGPGHRGSDASMEPEWLDTSNLEYRVTSDGVTTYIPETTTITSERYDASGVPSRIRDLLMIPIDYMCIRPSDAKCPRVQSREKRPGDDAHEVQEQLEIGQPCLPSALAAPRIFEVKMGVHNPDKDPPWVPLPLFDDRLAAAHQKHATAFYERQQRQQEREMQVGQTEAAAATGEEDEDDYDEEKGVVASWRHDQMIDRMPTAMHKHLKEHKKRSDALAQQEQQSSSSSQPAVKKPVSKGANRMRQFLKSCGTKVDTPTVRDRDLEELVRRPDHPIGIYNDAERTYYVDGLRQEGMKIMVKQGLTADKIERIGVQSFGHSGEVSDARVVWARAELVRRRRLLPEKIPVFKGPREQGKRKAVEVEGQGDAAEGGHVAGPSVKCARTDSSDETMKGATDASSPEGLASSQSSAPTPPPFARPQRTRNVTQKVRGG